MPILLQQARDWAAHGGSTADSIDPRPAPSPSGDNLSLSVAECRSMIEFDREVVQCILQGSFDVPLIAEADVQRRQSVAMLASAIARRDDAREAKIEGKDDNSLAFTLSHHEEEFYYSFDRPQGSRKHKGFHDPSPKELCTILFSKDQGAATQVHQYIHAILKELLHRSQTEEDIEPYRMLVLGHKAWYGEKTSAWTRGKTLLNAQLYNEQVIGRPFFTPSAPDTTLNSLIHMTARQQERSGVSVEDLRKRYGDGEGDVQTDSDSN